VGELSDLQSGRSLHCEGLTLTLTSEFTVAACPD
jgi:hypothetical protein